MTKYNFFSNKLVLKNGDHIENKPLTNWNLAFVCKVSKFEFYLILTCLKK